jgi:ribosomal protein S25
MTNQNFIRGEEPKKSMDIGKTTTKDDTYVDLQHHISLILKNMYDNYKRDKVIHGVTQYINIHVSRTYLRRLADLEIIKKITDNKKNMQYIWNAGDDPDFEKLAFKVVKQAKIQPVKSNISEGEVIKLSLLLARNGVSESKIPDLIDGIRQILYSEEK